MRVDSGVYGSYTIPPFYDPLISKLIVWGRDRNEAISRMQRALYEYTIVGVTSNIPFHQAVMANERFVRGELGTHFVDREVTLIEDMREIVDRQGSLGQKLSYLSEDKKKVAAIAAVTAMIGGIHG